MQTILNKIETMDLNALAYEHFITRKTTRRNIRTLRTAMLTVYEQGDVPSESWIYRTFDGYHKIPACWFPIMDYVCDKPIFLQAVANASYKNYIINTLPDDIDINGSLDDELFDGLHAFDDLAQGLRDILKDNTVEDREYQRGVELAIALQDISYRVIAELREKNRQYHHINKMRLKESKVLS